jgi:hypothetical protein
VPFTGRGAGVEFHYQAPANGWTFFALARSAGALDSEMRRPLCHIRAAGALASRDKEHSREQR